MEYHRQLTNKFDAVLFEEVRIVLAHVPSGDLYELGNMLDAYYASVRAYHERHAGRQIALGTLEELIGEDRQCVCVLQKIWT